MRYVDEKPPAKAFERCAANGMYGVSGRGDYCLLDLGLGCVVTSYAACVVVLPSRARGPAILSGVSVLMPRAAPGAHPNKGWSVSREVLYLSTFFTGADYDEAAVQRLCRALAQTTALEAHVMARCAAAVRRS